MNCFKCIFDKIFCLQYTLCKNTLPGADNEMWLIFYEKQVSATRRQQLKLFKIVFVQVVLHYSLVLGLFLA